MSNSSNEKYTYSEYYRLFEQQKAKWQEVRDKLQPRLQALSDKIEEIKEEMKPTKQIVEKYDTLIYDCYSKIASAHSKFKNSVFEHMHKKLMSERLDGIAVIQIEDDEVIAELKNIENDCVQKEEEKIKSLNKEKEPYLREIEKYEERIKPFRKEFDELAEVEHKELELKSEYARKYIDSHPYPEIAIGHVNGYSSFAFTDSSSEITSYSSASYLSASYSSSSSYDQDKYEREQADELRKQTEYARQQTEEARKQTDLAKRQLEEAKRQAEKAEHDARERRLEEDRRRRQQEEKERADKKRQEEKAMLREAMKRYQGVVYFKGGRSEKTGTSNERRLAEKMAQEKYDHAMKVAVNDHFKPTRYEVIEVYPW